MLYQGEALLDHIVLNTLLQSEAKSLAAGFAPLDTTYLTLAVGPAARYRPPLHQHAF